MRDRIDPLIAERAPWLFRDGPFGAAAWAVLARMLGYPRTLALAEAFRDRTAHEIMDAMAALLARDVDVAGLSHLPAHGPALIVSNHPTGIADGIMLWHVIARTRPDVFFYANSDILRVLPQMGEVIVPVEWRLEKRTHAKTRDTMAQTRTAIEAGRVGVIFPSGRLAQRRGLRLHERPWMASAAMIARKLDVPVIPVNLRARNSVLFYLFDLIHPTLRDITLFHETLNKDRQPYRIAFGEPISPRALPPTSEGGIEVLKRATLALGGAEGPAVSLIQATRRPTWVRGILPSL
ncbi:MAG: 1-acyl-sn-glycerol-3-phosphate acyltransferase [Rhodobacteraceae bacterium]|jgi:putative hemolysin|nr:1-acyl-sn-glycerol-3-phosphate acyltransferase [Paracoccaceae bacterium]